MKAGGGEGGERRRGRLLQFPAIERHDEVICSRDMTSTVSSDGGGEEEEEEG